LETLHGFEFDTRSETDDVRQCCADDPVCEIVLSLTHRGIIIADALRL